MSSPHASLGLPQSCTVAPATGASSVCGWVSPSRHRPSMTSVSTTHPVIVPTLSATKAAASEPYEISIALTFDGS